MNSIKGRRQSIARLTSAVLLLGSLQFVGVAMPSVSHAAVQGSIATSTVGGVQFAPQSTALTPSFTIEGWWKWAGVPAIGNLLLGGNGTPGIYMMSSSTFKLTRWGGGYDSSECTLPSALAAGNWYHIAIGRGTGGSVTVWFNGQALPNCTNLTVDAFNTLATSFPSLLGGAVDGNNPAFNGYIANYRATSTDIYGAATAGGFIPSAGFYPAITGTVNLLNTPYDAVTGFSDSIGTPSGFTSNTGGIISSEFPTYAAQSICFDGTDSVYYNYPSGETIGSSDFTLEMWIKPKGYSSYMTFLDTGYQDGSKGMYLGYSTDLNGGTPAAPLNYRLKFYNANYSVNSDSEVLQNVWTHVVATRSGGQFWTYINGTKSTSSNPLALSFTSTGIYLGSMYNGNNRFVGCMTSVRVIKSAIYSSTFVRPAIGTFSSNQSGITPLVSLTAANGSLTNTGTSGNILTKSGVLTYEDLPKKSQTITFTSPGNKAMGTAPFSLVGTSTSGLSVSFTSATTSTCTVSGTTLTLVAAGSCTINADQAGDGTYDPAIQVPQTFTITGLSQATFTMNAASGIYGSTTTLSSSGGSGGGAVSYTVVSGNCTVASDVLSNTSAGSCVVTATKAADATYLATTSAQVTVVIAKQSLIFPFTISSSTGAFTYGATYTVSMTFPAGAVAGALGWNVLKASTAYGINGPGDQVCTGAAVTSAGTLTCTFNSANMYPTAQALAISGFYVRFDGSTNYNSFSHTTDGTKITITGCDYVFCANPSAVTVTATNKTINFGADLGGVGFQTPAGNTGGELRYSISNGAYGATTAWGVSCSTTYTTGAPVGTYPINCTSTTRPSAPTPVTNDWVIANTNYSALYNANVDNFLYTLASPRDGNCSSSAAVWWKNCSFYTSDTYSNLSFVAGTLTVQKKTLTTPSAPTVATVAGSPNSITAAYVAVANATSYTAKVYASNGTTLLQTLNNYVSGSTITDLTAGTGYKVSITAIGDGANTGNSAESTKASVTTNPQVTPTFSGFSNISKNYGDSSFTITEPTKSTPGSFSYSSATPSVISITGTTATVVGFGTSVITATFTPTDTTNYISNGTITMTVSVAQAVITVTASSHTVAYGATIPTITPTYSGFVNSDTYAVISGITCTTTYTSTTPVGTTGSSCSGATASNYSFNYVVGVITIQQTNQVTAFTVSSSTATYGTNLTLAASGGDGGGAITFTYVSGPCSVSSQTTLVSTGVGSCYVTATRSANGNYLASTSESKLITIGPKNLTITGLTGINKEFDGGLDATATGTLTLVGIVGLDVVTILGTPVFVFADAAAGTGKTISSSGYSLTGDGATNYTLTQPTTTAEITKKPAIVTATGATIVVGASYSPSFTYSGLIGLDSITAVSFIFSATGTGTAPTTAGSSTVTPSAAVFGPGVASNYNLTYTAGTINIVTRYQVTFKLNFTSIDTSTVLASFIPGGDPLTPPVPVRDNFTFLGWYSEAIGGTKLIGTITPISSTTYWAHWIQNSLNGIGAATRIGGFTTDERYLDAYSRSGDFGSVSISIPAGALPNLTVFDIYQINDPTRASILLAGSNYVLSLVVAWLTPNATVPSTAPDKPITMTIRNASIKKGAKVYAIVNDVASLLGTASQDGIVQVFITDDPEVVVVLTKPDTPTGVTATAGNAIASISWTAPSDGGSRITRYTATSSAGQSCSTLTTACSISDLTNGTAYTFTVTATNTIGTSDSSTASVAITPTAPAPIPSPIGDDGGGGRGGGGGGGGSVVTPTSDPAIALAEAAKAKAAAEKVAADAKAAAELKAAQEKAIAEAAQAAALKAAQELADAQEKALAELRATQEKAIEDSRIAEELRMAKEKAEADLRVAAEKKASEDAAAAALLASKKIIPNITLYSVSKSLKISAYDSAYLKKYVSKLKPTAKVTCIGYIYRKNSTYAKAKKLAQQQATAVCKLIKAQKKTLFISTILYPVSKAPKAAAGAKWVAVSYRVDGFKS